MQTTVLAPGLADASPVFTGSVSAFFLPGFVSRQNSFDSG